MNRYKTWPFLPYIYSISLKKKKKYAQAEPEKKTMLSASLKATLLKGTDT